MRKWKKTDGNGVSDFGAGAWLLWSGRAPVLGQEHPEAKCLGRESWDPSSPSWVERTQWVVEAALTLDLTTRLRMESEGIIESCGKGAGRDSKGEGVQRLGVHRNINASLPLPLSPLPSPSLLWALALAQAQSGSLWKEEEVKSALYGKPCLRSVEAGPVLGCFVEL